MVVPSPICPLAFPPQHTTLPFARSAQACDCPTVTVFAPDTIAVPAAQADATPATLVDDPTDAGALRTLRRAVRDAQFPPAAAYITTDAAQPPTFAAFLRDALPYEAADGIVPDP